MESVCRLCLNSSTDLYNAFEFKNNVQICEAVELICLIKIYCNDKYQEICGSCLETIYNAYLLRAKSLINQKRIQELCDNDELVEIQEGTHNPQNFNCDMCEHSSSTKGDLLKHFRTFHCIKRKQQRPLICQFCGASNFKTRQILNQHIKRHLNLPKYPCEKCPMNFKSWNELYYHKAVHTIARNFVCDIDGCGKAFKAKRDLRNHKKRHAEKDIKNFECPKCGLKVKSKYSLSRHLLIHDGIKKHSCEICGRTFTQKNELLKHLRSHVGSKIYQCNDTNCNERFRLLRELRIHEEIHFINK